MPISTWRVALLVAMIGPVSAQVRLPTLTLPTTVQLNAVAHPLADSESQLTEASALRHLALDRLLRNNRRSLERDPQREVIVRGEILALDPSEIARAHALMLGFTVLRERVFAAPTPAVVVFAPPASMSVSKALKQLRAADPMGVYDYNHLYFGSGQVTPADSSRSPSSALPERVATAPRRRIGLIDTGIDTTHAVFKDAALHLSGCAGATVPAAHGTAVASLMLGAAERFKGVDPQAELFAVDVYCGTPTGGALDALLAAFAWLSEQRVAVINVSLVGPANQLLERSVANLVSAGYLLVAAVGNDGPAAPPLYPAAYPKVVGVTGVDARQRALLEAARGPQVMFAAPGADMAAASTQGRYVAVRGTSFASPIVAALLARSLSEPDPAESLQALTRLATEAKHLGSPGRDLTYGFGLVGVEYRIDPASLHAR